MSVSVLTQKMILTQDLLKLSVLAGSFKSAYNYLRQSHPLDHISGSFRGLHFEARRNDWPVIREVFLHHEYDCLTKLFSPTETPRILDLGAHIGSFALTAFSHTKAASIYSMEAAPDTASILQKNMDANPKLDWHLIRGAIWSNNDPVYLDRSESSLGHKVGQETKGEQVPAYTPDDLLRQTGWTSIDLIKMDIEGAESEVVPAAGNILSIARYLIIEIHNDRIDGQAVFTELKKHFHHVYKMGGRWSGKPVLLFGKHEISFLKGWEKD